MNETRKKLMMLLVLPVAAAIAYAMPYVIGFDATQSSEIQQLIAKVIGFAGCLAAATSFERKDHLRIAWLLVGLSYFFISASSLSGLFVPRKGAPETIAFLRTLAIFLCNVVGPAGMWLLARTWFVAGLQLPGSRWNLRSGMIVGVVIAGALAGRDLYVAFERFLDQGTFRSLTGVVSDLGDMTALVFVTPIILTALALRGGLIAWVWKLLAAATLCWLLFDILPRHAGVTLQVVKEECRILACTLTAAAGLAQRIISGEK